MNLILCGLAVLILCSILLSRRFAWAAPVSMAAGAALVLALLAADTSAGEMILTALAFCGTALLCGRDAE